MSSRRCRPHWEWGQSCQTLGPGAPPPILTPPALPQGPGAQGALKYRQFRIQKKGNSFVLEGWDREFPTLRELLDVLKGCTLKSGEESFTVKRCCPPKPGGRGAALLLPRERGALGGF